MIRIGQGIDVHAFQEDRPLILGGVKISDRNGLAGHSDADVVLHAITDALLGAVGAGDIGSYFPSSDPRWKNADSSLFVREALAVVRRSDGHLGNVDVTILAEKPRLMDWRAVMTQALANLLEIPEGHVNVKATTTDHLGFIGRAEGIVAMAIVSVEIP